MPHQHYAELVELVVEQAELIQTFTARVAEPERPPRRGSVELIATAASSDSPWNKKPAGQQITPDVLAD